MKHNPQRICVACRQPADKRDLVRIVRTAEGVEIDATGKMSGRGAYLHPRQSCWQRALEGRLLNKALRTSIDPRQLADLATFADELDG